jgi:hypothetical protein
MSWIPSFGLLEVLILAGCAGVVLLVGAVIVATLLNKRRQDRTQRAGSDASGFESGEWAEETERVRETRRRRRRGVVLVVIVTAALVGPLLAVVFGILSVIPVRRVQEPSSPPEAVVIVAPGPPTTAPGLAPAPETTPTVLQQPVQAATRSVRRDFLDPDNTLAWAIVLPSLAGLILLAGAAAIALIGTVWKKASLRSVGVTQNTRGSWARTRLVLLVLLSWFALCAFLVLDLLFAISLSYQFVALYAAFWVLVGALLLYDRTLYAKLVVLALFLIALWGVHIVDWTSRKPFLKDFYSIREGMTPAQVDRIMAGYIRETGNGPSGSESQYEYNQQGEIVSGSVTYRHTDKGWGDSDLGVVTIKQGLVTETRFLPD